MKEVAVKNLRVGDTFSHPTGIGPAKITKIEPVSRSEVRLFGVLTGTGRHTKWTLETKLRVHRH